MFMLNMSMFFLQIHLFVRSQIFYRCNSWGGEGEWPVFPCWCKSGGRWCTSQPPRAGLPPATSSQDSPGGDRGTFGEAGAAVPGQSRTLSLAPPHVRSSHLLQEILDKSIISTAGLSSFMCSEKYYFVLLDKS